MVEATKSHAGKAKTWIKNTCSGWRHARLDAVHKYHMNAKPKDCTDAQRKDQARPHYRLHHGHRGHYSHHAESRFRHFLRRTLHFFVLPAIFGVIGGLLACTLGMLVGQALAYLLNRRSRRDRVAQMMEAAVETDEKDALMEGEEMLPQYEDVDIVVVEQK